MILLVGLGNPGKKYEKTRHNIGFLAVDRIVREYHFKEYKKRFHADTSEGVIGDKKILVLKPTTYMNKSGVSVLEAANFYKIPVEDIIVIHDDIDLALGKIKVKTGGGNAGHNGLKDIERVVGNAYKRIRLGVGRPVSKDDVSDYVLSRFLEEELPLMGKVLDEVDEHVKYLL